ncbi:RagB/SusD family nutrient uptake outer membrane protein [Mucilaginibacter sp. SP1R1]|uniref:RagB/SusD family nutrient uptake outer membrane protein n=1 Tax=Mucilaginibacter sp. SP1R1 TaxID=2723091 RepID=UPI0018070985|nr:RagB/SusD family nutrient uptake outer membrane protein [Mucilaginibacter sp. SP1R1]MBB6149106.1 hypothetical protein [Mucilaginibacter sp. SP1R1]
MKLKNIKPFCFLISGLLLIVSCKKDFLSVTPTDRVPETAIKGDSSLFESFVTNRYLGAILQNKEGEGSPPGFGRGFEYSMWSSITNESIYNNDDDTWMIQRGSLAPENLGFAGVLWGRSYRSIRECNYALANITALNMSQGHKDLLIAELKFIRAFRYHDLIRNYGGVVLMGDKVTGLTDNLADPSLFTKASIKECIDYVSAELDAAAQKLPLNNGSNWQLGRATKGAALALKSRLLLYAASPLYGGVVTWQQAADAAKAVMDLNKYSIYQGGYNKLFLTPDNGEIIFERLYARNARHVCLEIANGPNGYNAWGGNLPLQNLVDNYEMDNGKPITDPSSGYDPKNPYVNRDPRFAATVLYNGATYRGSTIETFTPGGKDSKDGPSNWNTSKSGYYLKKFMDDTNPIDNPWDIAGLQPWIYFRYAEILLNYAEAKNEVSGPDASVYAAINSIRSRASVNMPAVSGLSQGDMRLVIRNERQIELAFEEHRYYDVRRWKIAEITENVPAYGVEINKDANGKFTYKQKIALDGRHFETKHYWLPIPRTEIQASNGLLKQNTGY